MKILITGAAGFIGFHLAQKLVTDDHVIIGIDNINDYYDVNLKYARLAETGIDTRSLNNNEAQRSSKFDNYSFIKMDITDAPAISELFKNEQFDIVVNLAAQAGVRYSLDNPSSYIQSNVQGFLNILEASRYNQVKHVVYASSSSVYGISSEVPFSVNANVDHPISLYAASKKANELMAYTYSHLFGIPSSGIRFFTAYGPWGRPDMAYFGFTKNILEDKPIKVFNGGELYRDFTYIDDIVDGVQKIMLHPPKANEPQSGQAAPYRIFNIGNATPVKLTDFITAIEKVLAKKAILDNYPMQPGDVPITYADISDIANQFGYQPKTSVETGIRKFVNWYKEFYN